MKIAIIGLGLIGGSMGLALKQAKWRNAEVTGYVRRPEVGSSALSLGTVDKVESSLKKAVEKADLIIIATPALTIKDIFARTACDLSAGCIVTDAASTKQQVLGWAKELLPATVDFIGGHPMAGKETFGIKAATADLFHGCIYCLTPAPQAKPAAMQTVTEMVKAIGATPLVIDARGHDNLVAGISHLPMLLSAALVLATTQNDTWGKMLQLASSGYRDVTRLASGNPEMNAHIFLSNQETIVSWIDEFIKELQRLRSLIANGDNEIERVLASAREARQRWLEKRS
jgi:prephenate dehydrogenase